MSVDHIRYDLLVRDALRTVVRRVVADVAKNGLPGEHHFYISFDTRAPGVKISPRLRGQYPEEMTIVLQHQFWDLAATDMAIEVGLSFHGIPERLVVPYEAIKGFFDPSVQFGLEFEVAGEKAEGTADVSPESATPSEPPTPQDDTPPAALPAPATTGPIAATRPAREKSQRKTREAKDAASAAEPAPESSGEPPKPEGGAEVVRLDRFRKK
jgi:hypothetical protein